MKWFASSVFWKASIVCSPSFCMERACGSVRFATAVKDLDFDHGTIIVREGKGRRSGLDVTRELGTQPARAAVVHGHGGYSDRAEGRSGVALPDALERKYPRAGHSWPWFWVFAQHTHSTDPRAVSCVAITCMTRPFSAPSNVPQNKQASRSPPHRTPSATVRDGLLRSGYDIEPCRICSAIPTSLRR